MSRLRPGVALSSSFVGDRSVSIIQCVFSALLRAGGQAPGEKSLGNEEQTDHRDGDDHRPSHQHRRGNLDAARELRQAQGDGPVLSMVDQE